jgi:deoxyribodipyrimidine photolyase-related protein
MSDYCGGCAYNVKARAGPKACPFNLLYWRFIANHELRLRGNGRMAHMVRVWDKFPPEDRQALLAQADAFLAGPELGPAPDTIFTRPDRERKNEPDVVSERRL